VNGAPGVWLTRHWVPALCAGCALLGLAGYVAGRRMPPPDALHAAMLDCVRWGFDGARRDPDGLKCTITWINTAGRQTELKAEIAGRVAEHAAPMARYIRSAREAGVRLPDLVWDDGTLTL